MPRLGNRHARLGASLPSHFKAEPKRNAVALALEPIPPPPGGQLSWGARQSPAVPSASRRARSHHLEPPPP